MPSLGHLVVGITISLVFYLYTRNKNRRFTFIHCIIFIIGSILPDLYTILYWINRVDEVNNGKEITPFIVSQNQAFYHSIIGWFIVSIILTGLIILIQRGLLIIIKTEDVYDNVKGKMLGFKQIYITFLSAGILHLGLDMINDSVMVVPNLWINFHSFWTEPISTRYGLIREQDFIVFYFLLFYDLPIILLIFAFKKETHIKIILKEVRFEDDVIKIKKQFNKTI